MDYCECIPEYKLVTMHQSVRVCVASPFCVCVHRLFLWQVACMKTMIICLFFLYVKLIRTY